ncbi:MAG: biotin transporter BioY [Gemmatimonadota bacterium]|nr:MAG: biotin transporter BioY [Gemmatimonadota bacterium]
MNAIISSARQWAAHEVSSSRSVSVGMGIVAFVIMTSLSAYVAVPVPGTAVPMTLQSLFVILAGAILGPWAGAAAMVSYLGVGLAGAPVFSVGHAGLAWLLGPTGGYLIAFPAAACAVGLLAGGRDAGALRVLAALVAGTLVVFVGGVAQLLVITQQDFRVVVALGVTPFVVGGVIKALIALVVVHQVRATGREHA